MCLILDIDVSAPVALGALAAKIREGAESHSAEADMLFQLAAVDYAYQRYDASLERYARGLNQEAKGAQATLEQGFERAQARHQRRKLGATPTAEPA